MLNAGTLPASFTTLSASGNITAVGTATDAYFYLYDSGLNKANIRWDHNNAAMWVGTDVTSDVVFKRGGGEVARIVAIGLAVTGSITSSTTSRTGGYTVGTLPAGSAGDECFVTDALAPTWLGTLTGGGAVVVGARKNATVWVAF
jgi:hypothetical protein